MATTTEPTDDAGEIPPPPATGAHLAYAGASRVSTGGTTHSDRSGALYSSIQQIRGYRETSITVGHEGVKVTTATRKDVLEKKIQVPDSWLRGFLQVQSAATLPFDHVRLAPMDLYNV